MKRRPLLFECEFPCRCGRTVGLKAQQAVVKSQTGARITCGCGQLYKVTEQGAFPLLWETDPVGTLTIDKPEVALDNSMSAPALRLPAKGEPSQLGPADRPVWALRYRRGK